VQHLVDRPVPIAPADGGEALAPQERHHGVEDARGAVPWLQKTNPSLRRAGQAVHEQADVGGLAKNQMGEPMPMRSYRPRLRGDLLHRGKVGLDHLVMPLWMARATFLVPPVAE